MTLPAASGVVLDTNVVLDWLVFRDPWTRALEREITAGRLTWRASPAMRGEFDLVLARPALLAWKPDAGAAAAAWAAHARLQGEPPGCGLHCRDADDQVFIDLAVASRCRWLISRDRALLKLATRARAHGVEIVTPPAWLSMFAPTAVSMPA